MEGLLFFIKHSLLGAVFQANFLFLANMLQSIQFGEVFSPLSMVKTAQLTLFNFSLLLWHIEFASITMTKLRLCRQGYLIVASSVMNASYLSNFWFHFSFHFLGLPVFTSI